LYFQNTSTIDLGINVIIGIVGDDKDAKEIAHILKEFSWEINLRKARLK